MTDLIQKHRYLIQLEHGYDRASEEFEFDAIGPEVAICRLEAIPNKRRALVYEDGHKIADLTFLEGFWQVSSSGE
jgi:hypothetical protein